MDSSDSLVKLLSAVSKNMVPDTLALSALQGLIAAEITGKRIEKGMTQKDFSHLLGVSQSTLSKWESGETNFTLSTLVAIATKLDIQLQSPFVPTPPKSYQTNTCNIIAFIPQGWHTASSPAAFSDEEIETESFKEM